MKERLMCFDFCALDVAIMKTGKKTCDDFLVNSHHVYWAGGNPGLEHWDLLSSFFSLGPPQNPAQVCTQQLL